MGLISGYADDAQTTDGDKFLTLASDGTTKLTPASNVNKYLGSGWTIADDSWSFSSYNSTTKIGVINANSGANTKYQTGMWVKFTQPTLGLKYGKITSTSTAALTIKFYDASVLSNEAITSPFFSTGFAPHGANTAGSVESADLTRTFVKGRLQNSGTTNSDFNNYILQMGDVNTSNFPSAGALNVSITFPTPFTSVPHITTSCSYNPGSLDLVNETVTSLSATGATFRVNVQVHGSSAPVTIRWMAVGPA